MLLSRCDNSAEFRTVPRHETGSGGFRHPRRAHKRRVTRRFLVVGLLRQQQDFHHHFGLLHNLDPV